MIAGFAQRSQPPSPLVQLRSVTAIAALVNGKSGFGGELTELDEGLLVRRKLMRTSSPLA